MVSGEVMCAHGGVRVRPGEVGPRPAKVAYYANDVVVQQQQQQANARHLRDAAGRLQVKLTYFVQPILSSIQ